MQNSIEFSSGGGKQPKPIDITNHTSNSEVIHGSPTPALSQSTVTGAHMKKKTHIEPVEFSGDPVKGRFQRLVQKIGKGANKEVFLAYDTETCKDVAWNRIPLGKDTKPEEDTQKNTKMRTAIDHKHIIKYLAHWKTQDFYCFITTLHSMSLSQFIVERDIKISAVKRWVNQILQGLEHLHKHEVIHRDIKCDNIFIQQQTGDIVIGDLGLSKMTDLADTKKNMSMVGTVPYMAPEQLDLSQNTYDVKVDIFALGMTIIEMITGEYPYGECGTLPKMILKITEKRDPDGLGRIQSGPTKTFINKCLIRNPKKRPTATELLSDVWFSDKQEDDLPCRQILTDKISEVVPEITVAPNDGVGGISFGSHVEEKKTTTISSQSQVLKNGNLEAQLNDERVKKIKEISEVIQTLSIGDNIPENIKDNIKKINKDMLEFVKLNESKDFTDEKERPIYDKNAQNLLDKQIFMKKETFEWLKKLDEKIEQQTKKKGKAQIEIHKRKNILLNDTQLMEDQEKEIETITTDTLTIEKSIDTLQTEIKKLETDLRKQKQKLDLEKNKITELNDNQNKLKEKTARNRKDIVELEKQLNENDDLTDIQMKDEYSTWNKNLELFVETVNTFYEINWRKWTVEETVAWICRLDNAQYRHYKDKLKTGLAERIDTGDDLTLLDMVTLNEIGILKIRDRKKILGHVKRLQHIEGTPESAAEETKEPPLSSAVSPLPNANMQQK